MGKTAKWKNLAFMLPMVLTVGLFTYVPLIISVPGSFQVRFVDRVAWGFGNYVNIIRDGEFWLSMYNTIVLMVMGLGTSIPIALLLAALINSLTRWKSIFKIGYFLPNLTSIVVVVIVMRVVFSASGAGIANRFVSLFGLGPFEWLVDPRITKLTVTLMGLWNGIGYSVLLFLAGLQVIPLHLYEAAAIDGANAWRKFLHITLPGVRRITLFVLMTGIIGAFQRFQDVFILSGNGWRVDKNLQTVMMFIYQRNFNVTGNVSQGEALAGGVILGIVIFICIAVLSKYTRITER
jgi:ABC-type sugar transport system permease subunit